MADEASAEVKKTTKKDLQDAAPSPEPAPVPEVAPDPVPAPSDTRVWVQYVGPAPLIVMDLGGEVTPGQTCPASYDLAERLVSRGDFKFHLASA